VSNGFASLVVREGHRDGGELPHPGKDDADAVPVASQPLTQACQWSARRSGLGRTRFGPWREAPLPKILPGDEAADAALGVQCLPLRLF
jgi:hypothetical protein